MQDWFKYCMCSQRLLKKRGGTGIKEDGDEENYQDLFNFLFIDDARKIFEVFVNRWREEFGVRDIKEEDIDEQDKKVNIYLFSS
jgi:hypothetical protein